MQVTIVYQVKYKINQIEYQFEIENQYQQIRMRVTTPRQTKNKSISPLHSTQPIKSLSPRPKTPSKSLNSSSLLKKSPIKQLSHQQQIVKLRKNRQHLCNTLDTYTLLIRSNNPIRCLQHNSNISIYCQTEQKLLCSSCIFNKLDHKYHKVVPVDKVHDKLERDIQIMQRQIERQVKGIEDVYARIFSHYEEQQNTAQAAMLKIQKLYQDARIMLDECEVEAKKRIILQLQKVQVKNQTFLAQLNFLKNVYKDQYQQIQPICQPNYLIYEHVMCNTVVHQGKFSQVKWKNLPNQVQKIEIDQCKRIIVVLDLLDGYLRDKLKTVTK